MEVKITQTEQGMATKLCLNLRHGLHSRPAAKLTQIAQQYTADIQIVTKTEKADAKSILDILSLSLQANAEVLLLAQGKDAYEALEHLSNFLGNIQD